MDPAIAQLVDISGSDAAMQTRADMVLERGARTRSSVHDGADAVMHVITGDDLGSGRYFNQTTPTRAHPQAYDEGARRRLRTLAEQLTAGR